MATRRRRRRNEKSTLWTWIGFFVFSIILFVLGVSIYKRETPSSVIKKYLYKSENVVDPIARMSKVDLRSLVKEQDAKIVELESKLNACLEDDGFEKGIIRTTSDALNMRSGPSIDSGVMLKIPNGSAVSIIYYDTESLVLDGTSGSWCKVRYAEQEGWVWGNYIERLSN